MILSKLTSTEFDDGDSRHIHSAKCGCPTFSAIGVTQLLDIRSAGKPGESLEAVVGEQPPDNAYTNAGVDLSAAARTGLPY